MTETPNTTTHSDVIRPRRPRRGWTAASVTGSLALIFGLVTACGTSAAGANAVAVSTATPASGQPGQGGPGGGGTAQRGPRSAASGTIAAVQPGTVQVQSPNSQTTVDYSDSTTFTNSQATDLSAVTAGSCITAAAVPAAGAASSSGASSAAPTTPTATTAPSSGSANMNSGPITATIVQLGDPVNGACAVAGGFGGAPPSGAPGEVAPSGGVRPTGQPGFGGQGGAFGQRASGTVASVSGDVITVTVSDPSTSQTAQRLVTVTAATVFNRTVNAASDALQVGKCAVVQGSADSKGAVTATSIAVSAPAAGATCNAGFGARRGRTGQGGTGQGGPGQGGTALNGTTGG